VHLAAPIILCGQPREVRQRERRIRHYACAPPCGPPWFPSPAMAGCAMLL
jgi:hypothetical protein